MKTSQEIENHLYTLAKSLNLEGEPKWVYLRFMLNISLSLNKGFEEVSYITDGVDYKLVQITGEGKEHDDYTKFYEEAIELFDGISISNKKELEECIERHIHRGFEILNSSLNHDSNIFDYLLQEFSF